MPAPHPPSPKVGPRLNVQTPFSTNAVSICRSIGLECVSRVEKTKRYAVGYAGAAAAPAPSADDLASVLHDRMVECRYANGISSFALEVVKEQWSEVDVMARGGDALREASDELGLAFDDADIAYYTTLFKDRIKRNPTTVECFDLSQSNSEHSRHWFFTGRLVLDGEEQPKSLMKIVKQTQEVSKPNNSLIAFHDNSSAIVGFPVPVLVPSKPDGPGKYSLLDGTTRHITLTAETHNFPTGIAPFPGATTGTGGRIRDNQSTGRGAHVIAGSAGYCVGNLQVPGYELPWEDKSFEYPPSMASPLRIEVEGSNGASDYGNKFGEPIVLGYTRAFGMRLSDGERREWVKPIMFTAGIGSMDSRHMTKDPAEKGYLMAKVGGPAYRIGMGGGSASSVDVQGDEGRDAGLDFNAVQRGDAEMEQKLNRVIRACIELGDDNPIRSIHDQGAGGNGNVLKEICEPAGGIIKVANFVIGDPTLSIMELWGAEYQENDAVLIKPEHRALMQSICDRERVPIAFVGEVTGDGIVTLIDAGDEDKEGVRHPFDMALADILTEMPKKIFVSDRQKSTLVPFAAPEGTTVRSALDRVLRLLSVGSKRFLTNKVDRSVTGLIAQQQCVGPLHTPLADVAVVALSHFDTKGGATAIGEQPIIGLVDIASGARMAVAESLTNLVWAQITDLKDVKCSGNWMWAVKLPSEGANLHDACVAMCDIVTELGFALDGGKDSMSMAVVVPGEKGPVKAPGELTISCYAGCPDVTLTVTPDVKGSGDASAPSVLIFVDIAGGAGRLGGSALAQVYSQLGDDAPDLDEPAILEAAFRTTQKLGAERKLLAGHDRSDGGLITAVLEMAFAGNRGVELDMAAVGGLGALEALYAEEAGLVVEVEAGDAEAVVARYAAAGVPAAVIGKVTEQVGPDAVVKLSYDGEVVVDESMAGLRDVWEATSNQLEQLQTNPKCAAEEASGMAARTMPPFIVTFETPAMAVHPVATPQVVATIREEGSNGDREMVAALRMAGFEVFDVTMNDIQAGKISLDQFRGIVFVGGFSYADTCGSAKGWAGGIKFNDAAKAEFDAFHARTDTFSLGICNGCQLMALLGWVGSDSSVGPGKRAAPSSASDGSEEQTIFTHNESGRFESRFSAVTLMQSPSIMLQGMEGSTLGVWVAHGEGRPHFSSPELQQDILDQNLAPIRYVDDSGAPTTTYPFNPNGASDGIAGLCSADGRHLSMMPHPERGVLMWQWPWTPAEWDQHSAGAAPWLKMFANAKEWCDANPPAGEGGGSAASSASAAAIAAVAELAAASADLSPEIAAAFALGFKAGCAGK